MTTQLLVMKDNEAHLEKTKHEENKTCPKSSKDKKLRNSGKKNTFSSYSNAHFKVEVDIIIPMSDGLVNREILNSYLKQL